MLEAGLLRDEGDRYVLPGPLPPLAIPGPTLRLAPGPPRPPRSREEGAQVAACIGREFDHGLLAAVAPLSKDELEEALAELAKAELIFRRGVPPEATYTFKHALVRDTAYESLLRSERRERARIAEILERQRPETADVQPELLAHLPGGGTCRASDPLAAGRSASGRAFGQPGGGRPPRTAWSFSGAAREGRACPAGARATGRSGWALISTKGYAAPETGRAYARAHQLCREAGDSPCSFRRCTGSTCITRCAATSLPRTPTRRNCCAGGKNRVIPISAGRSPHRRGQPVLSRPADRGLRAPGAGGRSVCSGGAPFAGAGLRLRATRW